MNQLIHLIALRLAAPFLRRLLVTFALFAIASGALLPEIALASGEGRSSTGKSIQPYFERVSKELTEFKLENGMKFIVLERHQAPVVSFLTYADVGGANEPEGKTGVAHFLEHLAFKGTKQIGTRDYQAEKPLLDRLDLLAEQIQAASSAKKDAEVIRLQAQFEQVEADAGKLVKQNELGQIVEQSGGVGLNANTSTEATRYFYSFPAVSYTHLTLPTTYPV